MRLSEIYKILNLEFVGADMEISALNSLGRANGGELSYCDSEKNSKFIEESGAGAILVTSNLANLVKSRAVIVEDPHLAFAILSKTFSKPLFYPKSPAVIDESVTIMPNVYIGNNVKIEARSIIMAGAYIGDNVTIGQDCIIHPNVVIYNNCKIGNECHINANAVIGSDGFGYAHTKTGEHIKIYHNGWVELEDNVEIGACTTIDRGVFEPTIVKKYSKIDNLVQIGHNCEIGFGCIIVSQTGLAGSTKLGRNVVMGGQSGTAGHLKIGDFAQIAGRGAVSKDLEPGKNYAGYPIMELKEWFKLQAKFLREFGVKR
ncbi:UDP-3-O-(3-hydroxymyristoyl)glucosamine N-acyltransferase [Campylobacter fetus]|uniref:UDP-3-O-acylglucosamine N-acyltransferase n=1 Tax=Campylobacter fetus subsp. testudinum TaxID=1507806 RepID=A0AAX0HBT7_CAMFE|nr:UDP-3-O-(3-hydroxymyristoyl)glucosamine N-acyltransferase [Campylobacter fetus]AVK81081.1 UDP-3-O-(3-hydroxymyristoyl)glucosamine N-acyltransferase [Campylobacter fetus subsp. testudinum]EAK0826119.1 UDP-3-O-(3-hydroxymyristoyl)glucosamine N-acyltransferase [Campylobacter fetus]EAK0829880.1 UDP-3-O-(3-hydroxymyristoyl)glucosamine N-acyltransferase [Campylobacter fetus]MPB73289.1 UDP-3-O-(3-hydroxymyristoyl)glucosamine N-acyltransferase [Campylobacter fetus]MPB77503.1 UDP-3-O-(3-hydroxymyris